MTALGLLALVPVAMWIVQTITLRAVGLPPRFRIDARNAPPAVRNAGRITTQLCLLVVILLYPATQSRGISDYYASLLPGGTPAWQAARGSAASILCLSLLFIAWIASDRIRVEVHQSRRKWSRRLMTLVPTAIFGAFVEELIFRGIVMADLMRSGISTPTSIAVATVVFAGAHYVRSVKRRWTFPGHLALGLLLCTAFAATGNLWLAMGLHGGGILMIMGTRPFLRYVGPAWLTGASIFPFAGIIGVAGLGVLATFVARYYPA